MDILVQDSSLSIITKLICIGSERIKQHMCKEYAHNTTFHRPLVSSTPLAKKEV